MGELVGDGDGGVFCCGVCGRERSVQGLEDHVSGRLHKTNVRITLEARGCGGWSV